MKLFFKELIAAGLIALAVCPAYAEHVTVAGVFLVIEPPHGYCALDVKSGDRSFFLKLRKLLRPRIELIQASVPCNQLKAMMAGEIQSYSRWAQVQVISQGPGIRTLHTSRSELITSLTKRTKIGPFDIAAFNSSMREKLKNEEANLSVSKIEIVGSDDDAAYFSVSGSLQSVGVSSAIAGFGAITLVKQLPISVAAYEKLGSPSGELPTEVAVNYLKSVLKMNPDSD